MNSAAYMYVDNDGNESYLARLPISSLEIIPELQRSHKNSVVKRISKNIHEDRIGALIVAKVQLGHSVVYHVCDGQHRYLALREAVKNGDLPKDVKVPCIVYTNLDEKECRRICMDCNKDRATISHDDCFGMEWANDRPISIFIDDIFAKYGFSPIKTDDVSPCNFLHGMTFYRFLINLNKKDASLEEYEKDQKEVPYVHMVLNLLSKLWDNDVKRTNTNLLKGVYSFFKIYGNYIIEEGISEQELIDILSRTTPIKINDLANRIKWLSSEKGGSFGGDTNQQATQRQALLSVIMMAYKYDFSRFTPNMKLTGSKVSDGTIMMRVKDSDYVDAAEFLSKTTKVKKYKRAKGKGYGYEFFDHDEESQDE